MFAVVCCFSKRSRPALRDARTGSTIRVIICHLDWTTRSRIMTTGGVSRLWFVLTIIITPAHSLPFHNLTETLTQTNSQPRQLFFLSTMAPVKKNAAQTTKRKAGKEPSAAAAAAAAAPPIDVNVEKRRLMGIWDVVSAELRSEVKGGDDDVIKYLATKFPAASYPATNDVTMVHCVFCHDEFDPRLPGRCIYKHQFNEHSLDHEEHYNTYSTPDGYVEQWYRQYKCYRCNEFVADPLGYCRDAVCSDDINDRLSLHWGNMYGDGRELIYCGFDCCSPCADKLVEEGVITEEDRRV